MRKWIAERLFVLAMHLDTGTIIRASHDEVDIYKKALRAAKAAKPKRKPGRPLGSKDKQPRKSRVRKETN
jgi:hypothetical protein